ncbi:MAG TPA: TolC family protein [Candidatus Acidoferrum sp.]|nr:TolC family protein [Candidatus Acidoferrum sp.]
MSRSLKQVVAVLWTAASLIVSPVYAEAQQDQSQSQTPAQAQSQPATPATPPTMSQKLKIDMGKDYSHGKSMFPNPFGVYAKRDIPTPTLANSPKVNQLIQDGKLMLSLEDAIALALENNLDVQVQRYTPWLAQVNLLRTRAGGVSVGTGASAPVLLGSAPAAGYDPVFTSSFNVLDQTFPISNAFTSGTGTASQTTVTNHTTNSNFALSQGFYTGTQVSVSWDNSRTSTNSPGSFVNPAVQSTLAVTISQPLLKGFGLLPNTRYIIEAKNTLKVADAQFAQAVIQDITTVSDDYWELVYAREFVKVEQAAVGVSEKLYQDNQKQLEIGTMAPLDVLTAESQLATDKQNLVAAQTTQLQDETILLNAITKDPFDPTLRGIEIIPTSAIYQPEAEESMPLDQAVKEAWANRPELKEADFNLQNSKVEVRATRNGLLPSLNAFAQYGATGLGGDTTVITSATPTGYVAANPIVDSLGNTFNVGNPGAPGILAFVGNPVFPTAVQKGGLGDALNSMINGSFPSFIVGLNLTMPFRNRSAQADNAQAQFNERQQEVLYRETQNTVFVNVRNALIALNQDRAQVAAAGEAQKLAQQTLDAEQKKYQLGSSTSYQVVLRARDLTSAQAVSLRARISLIEASIALHQAMGRTLGANNITIADAFRGKVSRTPNIPGALDADETPVNTWAPGKK